VKVHKIVFEIIQLHQVLTGFSNLNKMCVGQSGLRGQVNKYPHVQRSTNIWMPAEEKNVFDLAARDSCTASFTSLSEVKRRPLKLQYMQNKVLRPIWNLPRHTPVIDLHTTFKIPYVHNYRTNLCRQKAEVIRNHENKHVRGIGQGKARHGKYKCKMVKFGGDQTYDLSND
jgi:hypothetical protein